MLGFSIAFDFFWLEYNIFVAKSFTRNLAFLFWRGVFLYSPATLDAFQKQVNG